MSDDHLYFKFRPINKRLIESLVNPGLYFAKPSALNDPFDCKLSLRKSIERAMSVGGSRGMALSAILSKPQLCEKWQGQFENVGVCAFSLEPTETILWSHYADDHKGVCLLYRFPEHFLVDETNRILGVDKVKYEDDALTEWLKSGPIDPIDTMSFVIELTKIYLTAKSPAWKHEKETRIIRSEHGLFNIPPTFLEQVCFGLRTPKQDIDLVSKLAGDYCGCTKRCLIVRSEGDFGIRMEEL